MSLLRSLRVPLLAAASLSLAAVACGGSSASPSKVASLSGNDSTATSAPAADAKSTEQKVLAFAQCMRDHGLANFPDPKVDAQGNIDRGSFRDANQSGGFDPGSQTFRDAMSACRSNLDGVNFGGFGGIDRTKLQDAFVKYTACLRDQGLTDVKDPTFGQGDGPSAGGPPPTNGTGSSNGQSQGAQGGGAGQGGQGGAPDGGPRDGGPNSGNGPLRRLGLDPNDPKVQAADQQCRPALQQALQDARNSSQSGQSGQSGQGQ